MFALIQSFSVRMSHSDTDLKARVQAMSLVDLHKKLDGAKVCLLYCAVTCGVLIDPYCIQRMFYANYEQTSSESV